MNTLSKLLQTTSSHVTHIRHRALWKILPLTLFALLVGISSISAQEDGLNSDPEPFIGMNIKDIAFRGLINVRERDLRVIIENSLNQKLSDEIISNIIVDAFNLEYFSDVQLIYDQVGQNAIRISLLLKEKKRVSTIRFFGRSSLISRVKLKEELQMRERESFFDEGILNADARRIEELYFEKGNLNTLVRGSVEDDPRKPNAIIINFYINEGERLRITGVEFVGSSYSKSKLFSAKNTVGKPLNYKSNIFFFPKDYVAGQIKEDRLIYESFYHSEGYLDMRIKRVEEVLYRVNRTKLKVSKSRIAQTKFLKLVYHIDEGPRYTFGNLRIEGNKLFTTAELMELFTMKEGETFNLTAFNASINALRQKYISLGYAETQVLPLVSQDPSKLTISYVLNILESKVRNRVESIEIEGNTLTKDYVILRQLPFKTGNIYNGRDLEIGIRNLYYTRYFETVEPEILPGSSPGLVRIIIHVTEGQTLNVSAGLRISPSTTEGSFPISGTFQLSENNLLGRGYTLGSSIELGVTTQDVKLKFSNPNVFGSNLGIGLSLGFTHSMGAGINQDLDANGILDPFRSEDEYTNASASLIADHRKNFGMLVETTSIDLGLNSSLQWRIPIFNQYSRLVWSNSYSTGISYADYDNDVFRPLSSRLRNNFQTWLLSDRFSTAINWSTTDIPQEPNRGVSIEQRFSLNGVIPYDENIYYLNSRSSLDVYIPILELYASQSSYVFRLIFHLGSSFSILLNHPWQDQVVDTQSYGSKLLRYTMNNRGSWINDYGRALWSTTIELRYPVIPNVLTIDLFFDSILLWRDLEQIQQTTLDDFRFTFGLGPRLTIPMLPLAIYVTKNFRFKDGELSGDPEPENNVMTDGWSFSFVFNIRL